MCQTIFLQTTIRKNRFLQLLSMETQIFLTFESKWIADSFSMLNF